MKILMASEAADMGEPKDVSLQDKQHLYDLPYGLQGIFERTMELIRRVCPNKDSVTLGWGSSELSSQDQDFWCREAVSPTVQYLALKRWFEECGYFVHSSTFQTLERTPAGTQFSTKVGFVVIYWPKSPLLSQSFFDESLEKKVLKIEFMIEDLKKILAKSQECPRYGRHEIYRAKMEGLKMALEVLKTKQTVSNPNIDGDDLNAPIREENIVDKDDFPAQNIDAWGEKWEETFVTPAPDEIIEVLIYGEGNKKEIELIWIDLGLGHLEFLEQVGRFCWLVECSRKDMLRLSGAIRYEKSGTISSVGPNRKLKI